jgi:hypothetical protein
MKRTIAMKEYQNPAFTHLPLRKNEGIEDM